MLPSNQAHESMDAVRDESLRPGNRVYESAIDLWVGVLLFMTPAVAAVIGGYAMWKGQANDAAILFATGAFTLGVMLAFTLPCRYTLLPDALSIRCGLICYQVRLEDILSVEPTASLRSGPALSLRRVALKTNRRTIIMSPKDRAGFIADVMNAKNANESLRQGQH